MKSMNTNIGNMNNIQESKPGQGYCEYCKLMIAVSLSPNGYVAKQLVR